MLIFNRNYKYISMVFVIMMLSCIFLLNIAKGRSPVVLQEKDYETVQYQFSGIKTYQPDKVLNENLYVKEKDGEEKDIFDEELYKKQLESFFNSSMLFAAFLAHAAVFLYLLLKNIRRGTFEETQFIHMLILMDYIHRVDGGWACRPNPIAGHA